MQSSADDTEVPSKRQLENDWASTSKKDHKVSEKKIKIKQKYKTLVLILVINLEQCIFFFVANFVLKNYYYFQGPNTYEFRYDVENAPTSNIQYRMEERLANGSVVGSYGQVQPDGKIRVVSYIADKDGVK